MVAFKIPTDPTKMPGKGSLGAARTKGGGTNYTPGEGAHGTNAGNRLGPSGDTSGPGSKRSLDFKGTPPGGLGGPCGMQDVTKHSNPMKR